MSNVLAHIRNADPLLGRLEVETWFGPLDQLVPGRLIDHGGRIGLITHVDNVSPDGAPVVLVNWDATDGGRK